MKDLFSVGFLLLIALILPAQEGAPLLTHYRESREIENQNWSVCQDTNNVMLFANRNGILAFDGQEWLSIRIPTIPFSMKGNPSDGKIYIGGENSYGFLEKDRSGSYKYVSISGDSEDIGVITKIILNDSVVWFYGEQSISRHSLENYKLEFRIKSKVDRPFTGMVITPENIFINVTNKGLYRLDSDTLFPIVTGYLTEKVDVLFSLPYNKNMVLVGVSSGKLYLFDGIIYYDYKIKDDGYLKDNVLSEGIALGDSLYAFSTLDGGALVVEKSSGKIRYTINNQNELPDDEVFALGLDNSGGLWLSHQYGLTRAELNLPVGNFSIYPGLKGNLTGSVFYKKELYVATSEGVFYLAEVKNYSKVNIRIKNEVLTSESDVKPVKDPDNKSPRKNIITRIFGRKIGGDINATSGSRENIISENPGPAADSFSTRTVNRLKSINYIFRKVEGLNEKCRQLVATDNGILAATNKGLFVINSHKAHSLADNRYINFISWKPEGNDYYIAAGDGYFSVRYQNGRWHTEVFDPEFKDPVFSLIKTDSNTLWLGVDNAALKVNILNGKRVAGYKPVRVKNDFSQHYMLNQVNDSVLLYSVSGIYFYDTVSETFIRSRPDSSVSGLKMKYIYPLSNSPWVRHGEDWIFMEPVDDRIAREMSLLKIFNDVISINEENNLMWVIDGESRLFRIDLNKTSGINHEIDVSIKSIYNERGTTFNLSNIVFTRGDNTINFDIVAPSYLKQNTTQYQYIIDKLMSDWSPWSINTKYNLLIPKPGQYVIRVRAKDLWGNIGNPENINLTIKATFTQTTFFYLLLIFVILLCIFIIVRFREGQLQKKNLLLEEKVRERTAEIEAQKQEITSSIEYASRIQLAMLPVENLYKHLFSEHFIIFKPRDIVSGDFYWIGEDDKHIFFTVADCTGHGVPGAFMSTLGISTLNEIVKNHDNLKANIILNLLREKIKTSLHQTGKDGEAADGMDIAFCVLSKNKKRLQYSGAYNPLFIFQSGVFREYKGDRMPIGIHYGEKDTFTNYDIKVKKGDTIYIFSDGLADQFGGNLGSKYKISNFKRLISGIYYKPMEEQRTIIAGEFEEWKGSNEQVDDITIIGIRI